MRKTESSYVNKDQVEKNQKIFTAKSKGHLLNWQITTTAAFRGKFIGLNAFTREVEKLNDPSIHFKKQKYHRKLKGSREGK